MTIETFYGNGCWENKRQKKLELFTLKITNEYEHQKVYK